MLVEAAGGASAGLVARAAEASAARAEEEALVVREVEVLLRRRDRMARTLEAEVRLSVRLVLPHQHLARDRGVDDKWMRVKQEVLMVYHGRLNPIRKSINRLVNEVITH